MGTKEDTIVLIDNGEDDATLLLAAMERSGCKAQLVRCRSSQQCTNYFGDLAKAADLTLPRLVILDHNVDNGRGIELLRWLKRQQTLQSVPVVVLSGALSARDKRTLWESGSNAVHLKPSGMTQLERLVSLLCEYWIKWAVPPRLH